MPDKLEAAGGIKPAKPPRKGSRVIALVDSDLPMLVDGVHGGTANGSVTVTDSLGDRRRVHRSQVWSCAQRDDATAALHSARVRKLERLERRRLEAVKHLRWIDETAARIKRDDKGENNA